MPPASTATPARRNRSETEARLRRAVETLLVEGGFGALTPSNVARQAGTDKMLIYRYFGDLSGLVRAIAHAPDFFPSFEDFCGGLPVAEVLAMPIGQRAGFVLTNNLRALLKRPVVLELMVWEMVERNELTTIMEEAREALGHRIMSELFSDVTDAGQLAVASAILSAGVTYLAMRRRKIRWYAGVDLLDDGMPDLLEASIARMASSLV